MSLPETEGMLKEGLQWVVLLAVSVAEKAWETGLQCYRQPVSTLQAVLQAVSSAPGHLWEALQAIAVGRQAKEVVISRASEVLVVGRKVVASFPRSVKDWERLYQALQQLKHESGCPVPVSPKAE